MWSRQSFSDSESSLENSMKVVPAVMPSKKQINENVTMITKENMTTRDGYSLYPQNTSMCLRNTFLTENFWLLKQCWFDNLNPSKPFEKSL